MSTGSIVYQVAWRAIDEAIVRGLRRSTGPVRDRDVAHRCCISRLCTREQLDEALGRLVAQGLVRRVEVSHRDPRSPLFGVISYVAYEATREVGHGSR